MDANAALDIYSLLITHISVSVFKINMLFFWYKNSWGSCLLALNQGEEWVSSHMWGRMVWSSCRDRRKRSLPFPPITKTVFALHRPHLTPNRRIKIGLFFPLSALELNSLYSKMLRLHPTNPFFCIILPALVGKYHLDFTILFHLLKKKKKWKRV